MQTLKREKRKAERKFLKIQSYDNKNNYKEKCSTYYLRIKEARTTYYSNLISDKQNDMKSVYGIVNKLSGDRKQSVYPTFVEEGAIAEKFANFFIQKIITIRQNIEENNDSYVSPVCENNIVCLKKFSLVTADDLKVIFNEMKKKGNKNDPFPVKVLAKCFEHISSYILHIVNQSILTQEFPSNLKHATVLPLVKDENGDIESMKNYRPLYNTPTLGKIIEKCILKQIIHHLTSNNLTSVTQSGYKKFHSCETALVKLVCDIQLEIEKNNLCMVLMLDQSAAFDTVDLSILLRKLEKHYGICDDALKWMSSYLLGRTFSVVVNNKHSKSYPMNYGVPQGTILAPCLYTLYTGDLNNLVASLGLKIHSFADDTNIYMGFRPIDELTMTKNMLSTAAKIVQKYMASNILKLNVDKTQILFCGSPTNIELFGRRLDEFDCLMGDDSKRATVGKTLGVKIDERLKFEAFISETCSCVNYKLNKLKNMRTVLNSELKLTLVKCYVLSKIDYCNILLNQATKKQINRLQKVINSSVRFIFNISRATNVTPFMKKAHILPVEHRIKYKSCLYAFKILHGQAPKYLCEMVRRKPSLREGLRSSLDDTRLEPCYRGKTVALTICSTWNDLPVELRNTSTLDTFKRNLKTHYFRKAFNL